MTCVAELHGSVTRMVYSILSDIGSLNVTNQVVPILSTKLSNTCNTVQKKLNCQHGQYCTFFHKILHTILHSNVIKKIAQGLFIYCNNCITLHKGFHNYSCVYCTKYCSVLHEVLFCFAQSIVHSIAQLYCVQCVFVYCTFLFLFCTFLFVFIEH